MLVLDILPHYYLQILLYQEQQSYQNKVVPSAAALFVYVERAHGLPVRTSARITAACLFQSSPALFESEWMKYYSLFSSFYG